MNNFDLNLPLKYLNGKVEVISGEIDVFLFRELRFRKKPLFENMVGSQRNGIPVAKKDDLPLKVIRGYENYQIVAVVTKFSVMLLNDMFLRITVNDGIRGIGYLQRLFQSCSPVHRENKCRQRSSTYQLNYLERDGVCMVVYELFSVFSVELHFVWL